MEKTVFESDIDLDFSPVYDLDALNKKLEKSILKILEKNHSHPAKKQISYTKKSFNFACPYCGDSSKKMSMKRGHIYFSDMNYKCWNCGIFKPIISFMEDYEVTESYNIPEIDHLRRLSHSSNLNSYLSGNKSSSGSGGSILDLFDVENYAISRRIIMEVFGLVNVDENEKIREELIRRKQIMREEDKAIFAYEPRLDSLYIMNLTKDGSRVVGLQVKLYATEKNKKKLEGKPRFATYLYSEICKNYLHFKSLNRDISERLDMFSPMYNILRISPYKPINVFEGPMDANMMLNSIATSSAYRSIFIQNGRYFYDNSLVDETGKKMSIKMLEKGYTVFLWKKFIDDFPRYEGCKDLNDVMMKEEIDPFLLTEYFSNHKLDLFYV